MKKLSTILFVIILLVVTGNQKINAQVNDNVTINLSELTTEQRIKFEARQKLEQANMRIADMQKKIETYGNWVGVGGEIGVAVKEGLTAVIDVADKFGKTDVGKFTLVMVAWKVIGKDIIRIILGIFFIGIISIVIFNSYKNLCTRNIIIESNGWKFWLPKKYKLIEPQIFDGIEFIKVLHIFFMAGAFGLTYAIMFA